MGLRRSAGGGQFDGHMSGTFPRLDRVRLKQSIALQSRKARPIGRAEPKPEGIRGESPEHFPDLMGLRHRIKLLIEKFFARLKQYRAIATRYDKTACNFLGTIYLAASVIWLN